MSLWKRGDWWWADFSVNGVRYRLPLRDSKGRRIPAEDDYREMAVRAEEREILKAERGQVTPRKETFGRRLFAEAADDYLASRKLELAASSVEKETNNASPLKEYFERRRLAGIRLQDVLAYREARHASGIGPATINMEVGT